MSPKIEEFKKKTQPQYKKKKNYVNLPKNVHVFDYFQFAFSFFGDPDKQLITDFNKNLMTNKTTTKTKNAKNKISSR